MKIHMRGWRAVSLALATSLMLAVLTATSATAASAAPRPAPRGAPEAAAPTTQVIRAPLTVSCSHLTKSAARYAIAHRYCRQVGSSFVPYTVATGDCGSSVLYMNNAHGGNARFTYGFQSTLGAVIYRSLDISWVNWSKNLSSSFPDHSFMDSISYAQQSTDYTATGFVTGVMSGFVVTALGITCEILYPSDHATVT